MRRAQLDMTVSVIEESKSHGEPSSSKKEGMVLKQLPDHLNLIECIRRRKVIRGFEKAQVSLRVVDSRH